MSFYLTLNVYKFIYNDSPSKSIFIPLWFNGNYLWKSHYNYPHQLKYFNYQQDILDLNHLKQRVKFKILANILNNKLLNGRLSNPVNLQETDFHLCFYANYPQVSGLNLDLTKDTTNDNFNWYLNWSIKLLDPNILFLNSSPPIHCPQNLNFVITGNFNLVDHDSGMVEYKGVVDNENIKFEYINLKLNDGGKEVVFNVT